mmetsp:Transcript_41346/g.129491  ORF Transcript_41346/g.129491 Transcript_41346/m.129491 type:complete len:225 (-) Transcript_41346:729-1403(-)
MVETRYALAPRRARAPLGMAARAAPVGDVPIVGQVVRRRTLLPLVVAAGAGVRAPRALHAVAAIARTRIEALAHVNDLAVGAAPRVVPLAAVGRPLAVRGSPRAPAPVVLVAAALVAARARRGHAPVPAARAGVAAVRRVAPALVVVGVAVAAATAVRGAARRRPRRPHAPVGAALIVPAAPVELLVAAEALRRRAGVAARIRRRPLPREARAALPVLVVVLEL